MIFDMDGVVTDTAAAHAAAWKRLFDEFLQELADRSGQEFHPFDPEDDYRRSVDGKPRYDGVKSFLESRGIDLPFGNPDDTPDRETVCGLGNRKNRYFHAWLAENRVQAYPSTLSLIASLRRSAVKTGIFSSSRNCEAVLRNAGLEGLFDTKVDGVDLEELGIPGKPDPAMLRETVARLGVAPARAAVVEDAISGVEAGAAGGFGLVIGVDRDDYGEALAANGANLVVHDLGELSYDRETGLSVKTLGGLASVWEREEEIRRRLADARPVVFLDYDGTLTPIVGDYTKAFLSEEMRQAVDRLARQCMVAIVSGRDLANLKELVGLDSVLYAGSHGFDIEKPGDLKETLKKGKAYLPDLDEAERALRERLAAIEGHAVERKSFAIAVHYRRVREADVGRVEKIVDEVVGSNARLRKSHGKKVFQVQPRVDWNKGRALQWMLERQGLDRDDVVPLYIGDDLTDEDAFRALFGRGLGIGVGDEARQTAADYRLASPDDVKRFLEWLTKLMEADR